MSLNPILEGRNINFKYEDETIFENFNFSFQPGEHVVLKGESGSGKTTLFRLILGFEKIQSGDIYYRGTSLSQSPEPVQQLRSESAWLPQDLNIGTGTVREVIDFPFTFHNSRNNTPDTQRIVNVLSELGLSGKEILSKSFTDLSTGQRQRVGLTLCILLNRDLLLLDEPTSALDAASKRRAADLLLNSPHRTVISNSHDPFWLECSDTVLELNQQNG